MQPRYLVLSGELPSEGVWCTATRYEALVARVREVWGSSFEPIFKYRLTPSAAGAEEDRRYHDRANPFCYTDEARPVCQQDEGGEVGGDEEAAEGADLPRVRGHCHVILNDEKDFQLWYGGRPAWTAHTDSIHDPFHDVTFHSQVDPSAPHSRRHRTAATAAPLTQKLFAFRRTVVGPSRRAVALSNTVRDVAIGVGGDGCAAGLVLSTRTVSWPVSDNVQSSAHPYFHSIDARTGLHRPRSSPAVKSADPDGDDIIRAPLHTLLPPTLVMRLGVRVVLRHSNASEVILFRCATVGPFNAAATSAAARAGGLSSCLTAGEGSGLWAELVQRVRAAWGVHRPVFRYLDLSQGYQQISVTSVCDLQHWSDTVAAVNPELLVLEQTPLPTRGVGGGCEHDEVASAPSRVVAESVRRYRAAQPPADVAHDADLHRATHLRGLMARLEALEYEYMQMRVGRPQALPSRILADRSSGERAQGMREESAAANSRAAAPSPAFGELTGRSEDAPIHMSWSDATPDAPLRERCMTVAPRAHVHKHCCSLGGCRDDAARPRSSPYPSPAAESSAPSPPSLAHRAEDSMRTDSGNTARLRPSPQRSTAPGSATPAPPTTCVRADDSRDGHRAMASSWHGTRCLPAAHPRAHGYSQEAAYVTESIAAGHFGPCFSLQGPLALASHLRHAPDTGCLPASPSPAESAAALAAPPAHGAEGAAERHASAAHHRWLTERFVRQLRLAQW